MIVAGHSLAEPVLQEMLALPSGMLPMLMSVAAALNELERWVNWVSFQSLTVQTMKWATIVTACHSLTVPAPQGMPSWGMALALIWMAVRLDGLERWANWGPPLMLVMPMVNLGKRTTVVTKHSVLIAPGPQGMLSSRLAAVLMWVVAGLSWLGFEANWLSSLGLKVQTAARSLGHRLVTKNLTAEVVPQVFEARTWRDLLFVSVSRVR